MCAVILYACPLYMNALNMQLRLEKMQENSKYWGVGVGGGGPFQHYYNPLQDTHTHTHTESPKTSVEMSKDCVQIWSALLVYCHTVCSALDDLFC